MNSLIELHSGRFLDVAEPFVEDITIDDIAHGLSNTCRFGGQSRHFYSVAEHAVMVADRLRDTGAPIRLQFAGLHHDDSEAFLGDVPTPLKNLLGEAYEDLEEAMMRAVRAVFGIHWLDTGDPRVKEADLWALGAEAWLLLPSQGRGWDLKTGYDPAYPPTTSGWFGLAPERARQQYLRRHAMLSRS